MRPSPSLPQGSTGVGLVNQSGSQSDKLIQSDLDGSLALLAGHLSIRPDGQMKKYAIYNLLCQNLLIVYLTLRSVNPENQLGGLSETPMRPIYLLCSVFLLIPIKAIHRFLPHCMQCRRGLAMRILSVCHMRVL